MTSEDTLILEKLLSGLRIERIRLSRGSVTLEFDGMRDGEHFLFSVSTGYYVCCSADALFVKDVGNDAVELASLYDTLERDFVGCDFSDDGRSVEIRVSGGRSIFFWIEGPPIAELVTCKNEKTGDISQLG